jgi:hypothetical protein
MLLRILRHAIPRVLRCVLLLTPPYILHHPPPFSMRSKAALLSTVAMVLPTGSWVACAKATHPTSSTLAPIMCTRR